MSTVIEINYQEPYFDVILNINNNQEIIGYHLNTFREAIILAENHKEIDTSIEIIVNTQEYQNQQKTKEVYLKMNQIAEELGIPSDSFNGLVDSLYVYRDSVNPKLRSLSHFMESIKNKSIH